MKTTQKRSFRARLVVRNAVFAGAICALCSPVFAQDDSDAEQLEEITVTGTRIQNQNVIAASPVTTIGQEEIALKQTPNIERLFRDLPITIPGDGENVNNGTSGQATLDLRALGPERSLILIDGKRLAPYDIDGIVSTDVIPVNMLERVDVVTGGASAVYGSDALSGAVNFILRDDFEGFEMDFTYSDTEDGGEDSYNISALMGVNFDGDRGNITIGAGRTTRGAILLADRSYGIFGVSSATGSGLGAPPTEPPADCSGNTNLTTAHATGVGSTTAIPATLNLRSGNSYQFRDDGTLTAGECARFNFNPFNYYQTPQERWQATTIARYDVSDHVEIYARATFTANSSDFQIAPSGTFGTAFTIPVMNPFFNNAARNTITADLNTAAVAFVDQTQSAIDVILAIPNPTPDELDTLATLQAALAADPQGFTSVGIQDLNGDGVFDNSDAFTSTARRRTLELGARTGIFDTIAALSRSDGRAVRPESGYRHVDRGLYRFGDSDDRFTRSVGGKRRNLLREGNLCRPLLLPEDAEATLSYGIDRRRARSAQLARFQARFSVRLESELLPEGVELFEDTVSLEGDPWRHPVLSLKDHSYSKVTLCLGIEVSGESLERAGPLAFWAGPGVRSAAVAELPDAEESGVALSPEELEVRRQHLEALGYVD